ncbi:MAG: hypothetical protein MSH22_01830 [Spirochaetia bacterium]|nr:hypothetical protein [Spirochaetia bacterium]
MKQKIFISILVVLLCSFVNICNMPQKNIGYQYKYAGSDNLDEVLLGSVEPNASAADKKINRLHSHVAQNRNFSIPGAVQ